MLPLFDMLANAQNGHGVEAISRQFGLTQKQTQDAMEALLPAFSQGLKRNASDPYGMGALLGALSTGQHARYFEDPADAFSRSGIDEGNDILGHLFGSKELSRAVASQAAQATGIGQDVLKQMLPALAAMIMGGLFKQSSGQLQQGGGLGGSGNPFGQIIEQMMRQGSGMGGGMAMPHPEAPQPGANQFDTFGKMLEGMFGGGAVPSGQGQGAQPADNPFGRIIEEMMRGARPDAGAPPEPRAEAPEKTNPSSRPRNPYDDLFGDMFETGRKTRDEYQRGMESVFDQYLKGMGRRS